MNNYCLTVAPSCCLTAFNDYTFWNLVVRFSISPGHNPRKKSPSLMMIFTFCTLICSSLATHMGPYGPIWAHMDPYGPVYHFILFLYDLYVVLHVCIWSYGVLYMFLNFRHILKTHVTHILSHS